MSEPAWVPLSGLAAALAPVPAARVYRTTPQALTTAVAGAITFDAERFDTDNIHDLVTNPGRLTCRTAGKYLIFGAIDIAASAGGASRRASLLVNGSPIAVQRAHFSAADPAFIAIASVWDMAVGDYAELYGYQDSGGNLNVEVNNWYSPEFGMVRIDTALGAPAGTQGGSPPLVTALPATAVDGQEVILVDSLTAPTYNWRFRYVAAKATNKWVFVGGPPLYAEVATPETLGTINTYLDLATVGPTVTVPVVGDYIVDIREAHSAPGASTVNVSYSIGATAANDVDAIITGNIVNATYSQSRSRRKNALPAGALTMKYKTDAITPSFRNRSIEVTPIAV